MTNLFLTKDNSQPTDKGCKTVGLHQRLMQTDFSYYNVRKATEVQNPIKYTKISIVTDFSHFYNLSNFWRDFDVPEKLVEKFLPKERFEKHLHPAWSNCYVDHRTQFVTDPEFISLLLEEALKDDKGYFGFIKKGWYADGPFKPVKSRNGSHTQVFTFGIVDKGSFYVNEEWVEAKLNNLPIAAVSGLKFEVYFKDAKSSPYKEPKLKTNNEEDHLDSKGVLIELGDTVVYPRGGDHNFYWCDFAKVVRFTKEYMEFENGQKAMCRKCIVVKTNSEKKLSFEK